MEKVMTIRPPEELRKELKRTAERNGYTVNQLVLSILWAWVRKQKES